MIVAVDIGNTTISVGLIGGRKIIFIGDVLTVRPWQHLQTALKTLVHKIHKSRQDVEGIIICSVVPDVLGVVKSYLESQLKVKALVVGRDILVPIKNKYRLPSQVGQDRLVGAYAAKVFYGVPVIIVDFGTAITLDVVSKKGEYLGGIIVPGIRLTTEALFKKTALLPQVKIEKPKELIGRDTKNSILSGIFYGYGALCDGLIGKITRDFKVKPKVVVTGGYVQTMKYFSKEIKIIDSKLIFRGLGLLAEDTRMGGGVGNKIGKISRKEDDGYQEKKDDAQGLGNAV